MTISAPVSCMALPSNVSVSPWCNARRGLPGIAWTALRRRLACAKPSFGRVESRDSENTGRVPRDSPRRLWPRRRERKRPFIAVQHPDLLRSANHDITRQIPVRSSLAARPQHAAQAFLRRPSALTL